MLDALLVACLWQPPPHVDALRLRVAEEADRLRAQLQAQEIGADYSLLLQRKLSVDCSLAPLLLQEDAAEFVVAVAAGREPPDLLRLLRVEFGEQPCTSRWSDPSAPDRIARALAFWAAGPGTATAWSGSSALLQCTPGDSSPYIWWVGGVDNGTDSRPPRAAARACWYEPCVETRRLDWPLTPLQTDLEWDRAHGRISAPQGATHAESWPAQPRFNNPNDLYALFDLLRARNAPDAAVVATVTPGPLGTPQAAAAETYIREVRRADGSLLRTETWAFEKGCLTRFCMQQAPLLLHHQFHSAFELAQQVDGESDRRAETVVPASTLVHLPRGMRATLTFRAASTARDSLDANGGTVPDTLAIDVDGQPWLIATFAGFAHGAGAEGASRVQGARTRWLAAAESSAAIRTQAMMRAEAACARGDLDAVRTALDQARTICHADGVPAEWVLADIECCVRLLGESGFHSAAEQLATGEWAASMGILDPVAKARLATRAVRNGSSPLIRTLLGPLSASDPSLRSHVDSALEAKLQGRWQSFTASMPCTPDCASSSLDGGRTALLDAMLDTLTRWGTDAGISKDLLACLAQAACHAVSHAQTPSPERILRLTDRTSRDLGAVLAARCGELADSSADRCAVCARFEQRIAAALSSDAPSDESRAAVDAAIARVADLAYTLSITHCADRKIPQSVAVPAAQAVRLDVRALSSLVGNAYEPAMLQWSAPEPSFVELTAVQLLQQCLPPALAAIDRQLEARRTQPKPPSDKECASLVAGTVGNCARHAAVTWLEAVARARKKGEPDGPRSRPPSGSTSAVPAFWPPNGRPDATESMSLGPHSLLNQCAIAASAMRARVPSARAPLSRATVMQPAATA